MSDFKGEDMSYEDILFDLVYSWNCSDSGLNSNEQIYSWIEKRNKEIKVDIKEIALDNSNFWFFDKQNGEIKNKNNAFFSIKGLRETSIVGGYEKIIEHPIILQDEIGYLGFICKKINGIIHFLVQAKIEPGNINKIQLSPTIQATKSNFTKKHGGNAPAYLEYFIDKSNYTIVVDQIQSEQSSRFYKKRNRNIIIYIDEEIETLPSHKWMTLGQIKKFMRYDNIVNMDTRTVLSCIPFYLLASYNRQDYLKSLFKDKSLYNSLININNSIIPKIYSKINDYKMFNEFRRELIKLQDLRLWRFFNNEFQCASNFPFKVIFCDISIEGREVKEWSQPLFKANGDAIFGLITRVVNNKREFLIKLKHEVGCFDSIELGPTIQQECTDKVSDDVEQQFFRMLQKNEGVLFDTMLSEEGGRFYHEQNRNIIIEVNDIYVDKRKYIWVDYGTLNKLVQINNILNIQLRNLLSVLEV